LRFGALRIGFSSEHGGCLWAVSFFCEFANLNAIHLGCVFLLLTKLSEEIGVTDSFVSNFFEKTAFISVFMVKW
jgi:hypothetical protein